MIVVNDEFVYVHHPKTGGTFVTEMLRRIATEKAGFSVREISGLKHAGLKKIPEKYRALPVVVNVRNVFEHYVSRYMFRWWADPEHAKRVFKLKEVLKRFPTFPDLTFPDFLHLFNQWSLRRKMSEEKAEALTQENIGYNSWVLARLTTKNPLALFRELDGLDNNALNGRFQGIHFLRTEKLNSDLYELLRSYGLREERIRFILEEPPILPRRGGRGRREKTWENYFNPENTKFVLERDRLYFRLFSDLLPASENDRSF